MPIVPEAVKPVLREVPTPVPVPAMPAVAAVVSTVVPVAGLAANPIVADVSAAQSPAKTMRSLEEVRADLARLRESAKQRHARPAVPVRRDISFEPTDFMDFAKPAPEREPDEPFEQTAFIDFTVLKPSAGR